MKKNIGIDIGTNQTKIVQVSETKTGYNIDKVFIAPSPSSAVLSDAVLDQDALVVHIKQMLHDGGFKTKDAVASLHESRVFTRILELPMLSEKELIQALQWEAERYIPLPLTEVNMDFAVMQKENDNGKMTVAVVASPLRLIDRYSDILRESGLHVEALENEAFSFLRIFQDARNNRMIIDLGDSKTGIYVLRKDALTLVRTIGTGGNALTKAISSELDIPIDQAIQFKHTYGMDQNQIQGKLYQALLPIVNTIITEISQSITFFKENYPNDVLFEILLAGGGSLMPGLADFVKNATQIQTGVANPWYSSDVTKDVLAKNRVHAPELIISTGLAIRNFSA